MSNALCGLGPQTHRTRPDRCISRGPSDSNADGRREPIVSGRIKTWTVDSRTEAAYAGAENDPGPFRDVPRGWVASAFPDGYGSIPLIYPAARSSNPRELFMLRILGS